AGASCLASSSASLGANSWSRSNRLVASVYFLPCVAMVAPSGGRRAGARCSRGSGWVVAVVLRGSGASALDRDAHGAGGAGDLELGRLQVVGVEVGHLHLGDLLDLGHGDAAGHVAPGAL